VTSYEYEITRMLICVISYSSLVIRSWHRAFAPS